MMRARVRAMTGTDDGKGDRWRAAQNRVIRERRMKENTHSRNEGALRRPRLPHKHAKREGKDGPILRSPQRSQTQGD